MYFLDNPIILNSLIPEPIRINTGLINGKLFIDGDIYENIIKFSFEFICSSYTAPVLLLIEAEGKQYRYYCNIRSGASVSTPVFHPEFNVGQQFFIINAEPVVQLKNETNSLKNS